MWWLLADVAMTALAVTAGVLIADAIVNWYINKNNLREAYRDTNALALLIKEKKGNAVKVGIFDHNADEIGEEVIESKKGVSSEIHRGDVIELCA